MAFTSPHYKECVRDPEYPRWNYPWREMTQVGDFFTVPRLDGESDMTFRNKVKSAVSNATNRKSMKGCVFDIARMGEGQLVVRRIA